MNGNTFCFEIGRLPRSIQSELQWSNVGLTRSVCFLLSIGLVACLSSGCGTADGPSRAEVHGQVTLDGREIELGSISFYPTDGMVAGGTIEKGRYAISAERGPVVGINRIEIQAPRKTDRQVQIPFADPGEMTDELVESIPAQYNSQSTLMRTIHSGTNEIDIDIRSKE